jgi:hypothetical protein
MARVQHMVILKFKSEVTADRIDELFAMIDDMKGKIPGIEYCAGGPYSSPEGFNQGYTHGFLVTFKDVASRDAYLPHPEHAKVRDALLASIDAAVAFDFEE